MKKSPMPPPRDKRRFRRLAITLPVEFTSRDSWVKATGVARDLSLGGMFIETATPVDFGSLVMVGFTLPGEGALLLVSGIVRWTSKVGMGVQFGLLGARETHAITRLARARASDESSK